MMMYMYVVYTCTVLVKSSEYVYNDSHQLIYTCSYWTDVPGNAHMYVH